MPSKKVVEPQIMLGLVLVELLKIAPDQASAQLYAEQAIRNLLSQFPTMEGALYEDLISGIAKSSGLSLSKVRDIVDPFKEASDEEFSQTS